MSPLVRDQIRSLVNNFKGKVYVVQDNGDTAIVLVDPAEIEGEAEGDGAWQRVTEPTLMLVDPSRSNVPRLVN